MHLGHASPGIPGTVGCARAPTGRESVPRGATGCGLWACSSQMHLKCISNAFPMHSGRIWRRSGRWCRKAIVSAMRLGSPRRIWNAFEMHYGPYAFYSNALIPYALFAYAFQMHLKCNWEEMHMGFLKCILTLMHLQCIWNALWPICILPKCINSICIISICIWNAF